MATRKFMQTLANPIFKGIEKLADIRGVTVQQYIRAVMIPEWMKSKGMVIEIEEPTMARLRKNVSKKRRQN